MTASVLLTVLLNLAPTKVPTSSDIADAKTYFLAGKQAYAAGDYLAAGRAFQQAYDYAPKPAILFSIAQALRLQYAIDQDAAHLNRAEQLYRLYIKNAPKGSRREDALSHLQNIDGLLARMSPKRRRRTRAAATVTKAPTQIMVSSQTENAVASLDGGEWTVVPIIQEVPTGRHKIQVKAEGFFSKSVEAVAVGGRLVVAEVNLDAKPASVRVSGDSGAEVRVDGRFVGEMPLSERLSLPSGKHFFEFTKNGHYSLSQEVQLARGQSQDVNADLEITNQRRLSYYLLAGGAAAMVFGAGALTWAAVTHSDAQSLDDARTTRALSVEERDRFNDLVDKKSTLTTWGVVGLAGAALIGGGGALMYLIDQPKATPAASLGPVVGGGAVGAQLSGRF